MNNAYTKGRGRTDYVLILFWNREEPIMAHFVYIRAQKGKFVALITEVQVFELNGRSPGVPGPAGETTSCVAGPTDR